MNTQTRAATKRARRAAKCRAQQLRQSPWNVVHKRSGKIVATVHFTYAKEWYADDQESVGAYDFVSTVDSGVKLISAGPSKRAGRNWTFQL